MPMIVNFDFKAQIKQLIYENILESIKHSYDITFMTLLALIKLTVFLSILRAVTLF